MGRRILASVLTSIALLSAPAVVWAQVQPWNVPPPAALRGEAFRLESVTLGRGFDIYFRLPPAA